MTFHAAEIVEWLHLVLFELTWLNETNTKLKV